jgi:TM2 domain-containing membrane protein YozV
MWSRAIPHATQRASFALDSMKCQGLRCRADVPCCAAALYARRLLAEVCMAIYIHCPNCHERLTEMHHHCTHCGTALPPGVLSALAAALGTTPPTAPAFAVGAIPAHVSSTPPLAALYTAEEHGTPPAHHSALRPWLAALLSLICGLGQIYNGQIVKGAVLLICGIAAVVTWQFLPGKILAPCLWLYAISDAYLVARRTLPLRPQRQRARH